MFLLRKARLVILDVIFSILIFFNKVIQKSNCYWVLVHVCAAHMLSKSEKTFMSLNSKQKSLCQLANTNSTPKRQRTGQQEENDKSTFGSNALDLVFYSHRPKCLWNDQKKLSHLGQNIWKYKLMHNVTASFDATVRHMTEMSQWPKCFSKKWQKCHSEKKQPSISGFQFI